jgi:hypothetical protein
MKNILTFVFLLASIIASHRISAQCDIANLTVFNAGCNPDGSFSVILNFTDTNQSTRKYTVQGNGVNYGEFFYDNGIKIDDLIGDCATPFEFIVRYAEDPSCGEFVDLGVVCCGPFCNLDIELRDMSSCMGGDMYSLLLSANSFPPNSPGYDVFMDNVQVGFVSYDPPTQELPLMWNGEPETTIVFCDNDNLTCCDTLTYVAPCVCEISDMQWDIVNCNPVDSTFNFIFNADFQATSDSFTIGGNATNYGNFSYSQLPITIGPFQYGTGQKFDFLMADLNNLFCFDFVEPGRIDGCLPDCAMEAVIEEGMCNPDNTISFFVSAGGPRTGVLGFEVIHNGSVVDTFSYSGINYEIGPFDSNCNDSHNFIVRDLFYPTCDTLIQFMPFCCAPDCEIGPLSVSINCESQDADGFTLDFDTNLDSNEPFNLYIDGIPYGNYTAGDLPIMDNSYVFTDGPHTFFVEARDTMCAEDLQINVECIVPCDFGQIFFSVGDCDPNDTATISFSFDTFESPSDSFDLFVNGVYQSTNAYNNNYEVQVLADCMNGYEIDIIDSENPDCNTFFIVDPICCPPDPCEIDITSINVGDCDMNGNFEVSLSIASNMSASDSFELRGNGNSYGTFAYTQSPIGLTLAGDCATIYEFVIIDEGDATCTSSTALSDPICCPIDTCAIEVSNIEVGDCTMNGNVEIALNISSNMSASDSFELRGNGTFYGQFAYTDSPVSLILNGDCSTLYEFIIIDSEDANCTSSTGLSDPICCPIDTCEIAFSSVTVGSCDENDMVEVRVIIESNRAATDTYSLFGNQGLDFGVFTYSMDTLTIDLPSNCTDTYELFIRDNTDTTCTDVFEFAEPLCCDTLSCEIEVSLVEIGDCTMDGLVPVFIRVSGNAASSDSFSIFRSELAGQLFPYDQDVPVFLEGDCSSIYEIIVRDSEDENCTDFLVLSDVLCCSCEIAISNVEIGNCNDSGFIPVSVTIEASSVASDSFELRGNGNFYGVYAYEESPVLLILEGDCSTLYEFVARDQEDNDCQAVFEFTEPLCCEMDMCIVEISNVEVGECREDNFFLTAIFVEAEGMSSDSFTLRGNGNNYGTYAYEDSPVLLELEGDCQTLYEFIAIDTEDDNCRDAFGLDNIVCCDSDCALRDIVIGDCDGILYNVSFIYDGTSLEDGLLIGGSDFNTVSQDGNVYTVFGLEGNGDTLRIVVIDTSNNCELEFFVANDCTSSLEELAQYQTKVWASPGGLIRLESDQIWWEEMALYNLLGEKLYTSEMPAIEYNVTSVIPDEGIYFVALRKGKRLQTYKVFVSR